MGQKYLLVEVLCNFWINKEFATIIEQIKIDHSKMYFYEGLNTNSLESFWAIVKRDIIGQYRQVSDKYLPNYMDKFCFKYNDSKFDDMFKTLFFNPMLHIETLSKTLDPRNKEHEKGKIRAIMGILA